MARIGEKNHIVAGPGPSGFPAKRSHAALCPVAPDSIAKLFARNKSNTTFEVVFRAWRLARRLPLLRYEGYERSARAPAL